MNQSLPTGSATTRMHYSSSQAALTSKTRVGASHEAMPRRNYRKKTMEINKFSFDKLFDNISSSETVNTGINRRRLDRLATVKKMSKDERLQLPSIKNNAYRNKFVGGPGCFGLKLEERQDHNLIRGTHRHILIKDQTRPQRNDLLKARDTNVRGHHLVSPRDAQKKVSMKRVLPSGSIVGESLTLPADENLLPTEGVVSPIREKLIRSSRGDERENIEKMKNSQIESESEEERDPLTGYTLDFIKRNKLNRKHKSHKDFLKKRVKARNSHKGTHDYKTESFKLQTGTGATVSRGSTPEEDPRAVSGSPNISTYNHTAGTTPTAATSKKYKNLTFQQISEGSTPVVSTQPSKNLETEIDELFKDITLSIDDETSSSIRSREHLLREKKIRNIKKYLDKTLLDQSKCATTKEELRAITGKRFPGLKAYVESFSLSTLMLLNGQHGKITERDKMIARYELIIAVKRREEDHKSQISTTSSLEEIMAQARYNRMDDRVNEHKILNQARIPGLKRTFKPTTIEKFRKNFDEP